MGCSGTMETEGDGATPFALESESAGFNSEEQVSLFEAATCLMALLNADGQILAVNGSLSTTFLQSRADFVGKPCWKEFVDQRDGPKFRRFFLSGFSTPSRKTHEANKMVEPRSTVSIVWTLSQLSTVGKNGLQFVLVGEDVTERIRLKNQLTEAQEKFETFMDSLPGIAFIKDKNRRLTYVSKRFQDVFECDAQDGIGRRDEDFLPRAVARRIKEIDERLLKFGGTEVSIEEDEAVSGNRRWMIHRFAIGEGPKRKLGGISLEISDFTHAEDSFRAAAQASSDLILILRPERDERGKVRGMLVDFINRLPDATLDKSGFSLGGSSLSEVLSALGREDLFLKLLRTVETGISITDEICWTAANGDRRFYCVFASRAGDFLALNLREVTQEKAAKDALHQAVLRYRGLFEGMPVACMALDLDGCVIDWNPQCEALYGFTSGEVLGQSIVELVADEETVRIARKIRAEYQNTGGFHSGSEWQVFRKDEEPIWVFSSSLPLTDSEGGLVGTISCNVDITDRKRFEAKLHASNRDLEQFASSASHDLLEPLRMVCTFLELLEQESGDLLNSRNKEYLHFAVDGGARMQAMVRSLLDFSKLSTLDFESQYVDMNEVCETVARDLRFALEDAGASLTFDGLPEVYGSRNELVRLILNLVANSIKFRKESPCRIVVAADRIDGVYQLSVSDNGIGIAPKHAQKVFEVFQRLNHRDLYEGCGIGLSLCKKIVDRHGGTIWVDTTATSGCRINFTLQRRLPVKSAA